MKRFTAAVLLFACSGCTMVNTVRVDTSPGTAGAVFVTAGDISQPYDSLGLIQTTKSGVRLLGFFDPAGTDLNAGFHQVLIPTVRTMGGDGVINVRFHQTQLNPVHQALLLFPFFFIPQVLITGEVVKLRSEPPSTR
jgi:hypothetical protein